MKKLIVQSVSFLLIAVLALPTIAWTGAQLKTEQQEIALKHTNETPLYLPEVKYVKLITLGFNDFFSTLLWFKTLSYFGEHYETDRNYDWLGHMCELVTDLDYKARHAFEFCSTMLSWVARNPERSTAILSSGIDRDPLYWRYRYLRGFNYWYFLKRFDLAEKDLEIASSLPEAPPFLAALASRIIVFRDRPETAIGFLKELIGNTNNKAAHDALQEQLKLAYVSRDLRALKEAAEKYFQINGIYPSSWGDLVTAGIITQVPVDPFGDEYVINQLTGEISTKSGKKGLEFLGRTAETGLAAKVN